MVYCCVPHCKSQSSRTKGVSFHQFPSDAELVAKCLKNTSRENLVVNDKTASAVVCSRHFLSTDYVPGYQIRKLILPGVVPTVFDEYPSYLVLSAKKPRKEPASRCSVPAPKPSKRKAEPEGAVDLPESQDDFAHKKHSVCTQTANKDAQRVSAYVSLIGRLCKHAAYHHLKCSKLQQQLDTARKANAFYRENKRHASVKEVVADSAKGEKKAIFLFIN
ncbi:hypothetical protein HPB49_006390 [Dermacentor silvarum]|uniref:Uncharacterized protein n=1 Tax=Dermacentor silvarum TaxID=543639 RepID=A0ACB8CQB2_DERSI|nr:hypothetical protein HPB49_006390 [Dermacentor silvarum]